MHLDDDRLAVRRDHIRDFLRGLGSGLRFHSEGICGGLNAGGEGRQTVTRGDGAADSLK